MALIKCPECGKEVSSAAETCINCGYPIGKYLEDKTKKDVKDIDEKYVEIRDSDISDTQKIEKLKEIVETNPYWKAYNRLGLLYDDKNALYDNLKIAEEFYRKALASDYVDKKVVLFNLGTNLGHIANHEQTKYAWDGAIKMLKESRYADAYVTLAYIYDPQMKDLYNYPNKDSDTAIDYYNRAIFAEDTTNSQRASAMNNSACLYEKDKNALLIASIYSWVAYKYDAQRIFKDNYNTIISKFERSTKLKYRKRIESIRNIEDIKQFQEEQKNGQVCPRCGFATISAGARGYGGFLMNVGATKTVNRCSTCGYTWKPKL